MAKKRHLKLTKCIPDGVTPPFAVVVPAGDEAVIYHVKISDALIGDCPEFTLALPKSSKNPPPTPEDIAFAGACECNEGRGVIIVTRWRGGVPDLVAIYLCNGRQMMCCQTTCPEEAPVTHPLFLPDGDERREAFLAFLKQSRESR